MAQTASIYGSPSSLTLTSTWSCTYYATANQLGAITYHRSYGSPSTKSGSITFDLTSLPSNITINSTKVYATVSNGDTYGSGTITVGGVSFSRSTGYVTIANPSASDTSLTVPFTYKASNHSGTYHDSSSTSSSKTSSHSSPITFSDIYLVIDYTVNVTACTAPMSVSVSANNVVPGTAVTLSWSGAGAGTNNAITGYHVYRATSASGSYSYLGAVSTTATSGSMSITASTTPGASYYYKVYTIGSVSGYNSGASGYATLTTLSYTACTAPSSVTVSSSSVEVGETVTLSWSGAAAGTNNAIVGYHVYRAASATGTYEMLTSVETNATYGSTTVTAPTTQGSSYYYKVYTIGAVSGYHSGESSIVAISTIVHTDCIAPDTCLLDCCISHENVTLYWGNGSSGTNNNMTGYEVQRCESYDGSTWSDWTTLTTQTDVTLTVDPPAVYGNYYWYRVRTKGEVTDSPWRNCSHTLRRDHEPIAAWTDESLVAGETMIKAIHMTEMQHAINVLLDFYGLGAQEMTSILSGETSLGGWTNHMTEIRNAVDLLSTEHEAWEEITVNCPKAATMQQLRDAIVAVQKPQFVLGVNKLGAMVL